MKQVKYGVALSGVLAAVGYLICLLNYDITADTPLGCVLWSAQACTVLMVTGFIGSELGVLIKRKKFRATGRRNIAISLALSLVIGILFGAVGQIVYAIEIEEKVSIPIIGEGNDNVNTVFLLDCSTSMDSQHASCVEAIDSSLDGMNESITFQLVAFSSYDIDESTDATEFLPVSPGNLSQLKAQLAGIDVTRIANNFDIALDYAVNKLEADGKSDCRNLIVMISDCVGDVREETLANVEKSGVELNVIDIQNYQSIYTPNSEKPLRLLADRCFDVKTESSGNGPADKDEIVQAVAESLTSETGGSSGKASSEKKLVLSEEMLVGLSGFSIWHMLVKVVFYALFSVVANFIFYGYNGISKLIINLAVGAFAGMISAVISPLGIAVLILAGLGGIVKYEITEEA